MSLDLTTKRAGDLLQAHVEAVSHRRPPLNCEGWDWQHVGADRAVGRYGEADKVGEDLVEVVACGDGDQRLKDGTRTCLMKVGNEPLPAGRSLVGAGA